MTALVTVLKKVCQAKEWANASCMLTCNTNWVKARPDDREQDHSNQKPCRYLYIGPNSRCLYVTLSMYILNMQGNIIGLYTCKGSDKYTRDITIMIKNPTLPLFKINQIIPKNVGHSVPAFSGVFFKSLLCQRRNLFIVKAFTKHLPWRCFSTFVKLWMFKIADAPNLQIQPLWYYAPSIWNGCGIL